MKPLAIKKSFPISLWIGSVLLMPVFLLIIALIAPGFDVPSNWLAVGLILVVSGLYLSIPTFLISVIIFYTISMRLKSEVFIKIIHGSIAVFGIIKTYQLLPENSLLNPGDDLIYYSVASTLGIVTSIIYFKAIRQKPAANTSL